MAKTVVVLVERLKEHPKYRKRYRVSKKYKAHDEKGEYKAGDTVVIEECRPLSADKKFRVVSRVAKGAAADQSAADEKSEGQGGGIAISANS